MKKVQANTFKIFGKFMKFFLEVFVLLGFETSKTSFFYKITLISGFSKNVFGTVKLFGKYVKCTGPKGSDQKV